MAATLNDLVFYYSGGAGNSDSNLSKGGARGSRLFTMSKTLQTNSIDGLTFIEAVGFQDGETITIDYDASTDTISVNSNTLFNSKVITGDETVVFSNSTAYIILDVVFSLIEASTTLTADYQVNKIRQNIFDDAEPIQTTEGYIDYRVVYLYNESANDATNVTLFVQQPAGPCDVLISDYALNTDVTEQATLEDEPSNNGFQYTYSYGSGINIGTLPAGEYIAVILRRQIYSNIQQTTNNNMVLVAGVD